MGRGDSWGGGVQRGKGPEVWQMRGKRWQSEKAPSGGTGTGGVVGGSGARGTRGQPGVPPGRE